MKYVAEPEVEAFINELKEQKGVLGIAVYGSQVRGNTRPDSDIDLYILVDNGVWRDVETRSNKTFELVYSSKAETEKHASAHLDDYLNLMSLAKIVYDENGQLGKMQEEAMRKIEAGKKPLDTKAAKHSRFNIEDTLRAVRAIEDEASAELVIQKLVLELSEVFFDLIGQWTPAPKQRLDKVRELSVQVGAAFDDFYTAKTLESRTTAADKISALVFQ